MLLQGRHQWMLPLEVMYVWTYNGFFLLMVVAGVYVASSSMLHRQRAWQVQWKRRRTLAQTFSTTISRRSGCRPRLGRSVPGQICGHLCLALNQSYPFRLRGWRWQWVVTELRQVMLDATGAGVSRFTVSMDNGFAFLAADEVVLVSDEPYHSKEQYQQRNRWMVDYCDCLVAAYAGVEKSATHATIRYAQAQGRDVLLLDSVKRERRWVRGRKRVR